MRALNILFYLAFIGLSAQSKKVTESVQLAGQTNLELELSFASRIIFKTWGVRMKSL